MYYSVELDGREVKLRGLKKAVSDTKKCRNYSRVYMNVSTGEIWHNEYVSCESWTDYHDENIMQVYATTTWHNAELTQDKLCDYIMCSLSAEYSHVSIISRDKQGQFLHDYVQEQIQKYGDMDSLCADISSAGGIQNFLNDGNFEFYTEDIENFCTKYGTHKTDKWQEYKYLVGKELMNQIVNWRRCVKCVD